MSIEQLERNERCEDNPRLRMMHAEVSAMLLWYAHINTLKIPYVAKHAKNFNEAFRLYNGDPLKGGFRKITEWFDLKQSWQIFFGSDGSGATLHWHAAAFNIL